jgi:hypothetical protein
MEQLDWQNKITEPIKGMLVTHPGMHPGAMRVDQLDREQDDKNVIKYPEIVHFGTRPQQLCYAGNAEYQKVWREYIKFRHLLANMPKPTFKVCIYFLISKKIVYGNDNKISIFENCCRRVQHHSTLSKSLNYVCVLCNVHVKIIPSQF